MDRFVFADRVRIKSKNQPRRPSRNKPLQRNQELEVISTQFYPSKFDGEALVRQVEGVQTERWVPFSVLEIVRRNEEERERVRDHEDGRVEARRTGQLVVKHIRYDPRADFLTAAELKQGKATPNTWHYPNTDYGRSDPCNSE